MKHKYFFKLILSLALLILGVSNGHAQLATWDFTGDVLTSSSSSAGVTASTATHTGLNNISYSSACTGRNFNPGGWNTTASINTADDYAEFVITADTGYNLSVTGFTYDAARTSTGPSTFDIRSSNDSYAATLSSGAILTTPCTSSGGTFTAIVVTSGNSLTFRIYGYNASSSSGRMRIDNVSIAGTATLTTSTWQGDDGTSPTDWATAENWSNGLPTSDTNITIPNVVNKPVIGASTNALSNDITIDASSSLTITGGGSLNASGNLVNNGTLTINSDATSNGSLIVAGTSSGDITYNRYVTFNATGTLGWHLVGSPLVGETIQDIITNGSLADGSGGGRKGLATYDNDQNDVSFGSWVYTTTSSTGSMNSGVGYSIKRSAAGTIPFTGTLKTDDLSSYAISVGTANNWNLIGNPYPSFININTAADGTNHFLTTANINQLDGASAAVYIWDSEANSGNGGYTAITNASGASYLAPGQGFFLASKTGGGTIDITEAMQTHQSGDLFLRSATIRPEITLQISDGTSVKSTEIKYIDDNVSTGLDPGYDAKLFDDTDNSFAVYTHLVADSQGLDFMLQAIPNTDHENMIIPVGVNATAGSEITFTASALHIPNGLNVFLEDKETNTFTRLDEANAEYKITLATDLNGIGRFYLHMNTEGALSTDSFSFENIAIYKTSEMTLRVTGLQNENTSLLLYDILGKQVLKTSFVGSGLNDIPLPNLRSGIYIVQLQTDQGKLNKKIVIE